MVEAAAEYKRNAEKYKLSFHEAARLIEKKLDFTQLAWPKMYVQYLWHKHNMSDMVKNKEKKAIFFSVIENGKSHIHKWVLG